MSNDLPLENRMLGFDPTRLYEYGITLEEADLVVGATTNQVIGRTAALSLMAFRSQNGEALFRGVTVIAPPFSAWNKSQTDILELIVDGVNTLRPNEQASAKEIEKIKMCLTILRCSSLEASSLITEVQGLIKQFILIPMAHVYRHPNISEPRFQGKLTTILEEDIWVPQLEALVSQCLTVIKGTESSLVFEVPKCPPSCETHRKNLEAVNGLYPVFLSFEGLDPSLILRQNAQRWAALAASGNMDNALKEIDAFDIAFSVKEELKIQILSRGHDDERTLGALQKYLACNPEMEPELAIKFARLAIRIGDKSIAVPLIEHGLNSISDRSHLEAILTSCKNIENSGLEVLAYNRLKELFPGSHKLSEYRESILLMLCADASMRTKEILSQIEFTEVESLIVNAFNHPSKQKIETLLHVMKSKPVVERDLALLCYATYLLSQQSAQESINIAINISNQGHLNQRACWLVISALKRMLLEDRLSSKDTEYYSEPVSYVRNFIANHPEDQYMREAFSSLFSVDFSGNLGLAILVAQAMNLTYQVTQIRNEPSAELQASTDELHEFLERVDAWLNEIGALDVSHTCMPLKVIGDNPQSLLNALEKYIRFLVDDEKDGDIEKAEHMTFVACTMAGYVTDTAVDIDALRMVACRLIGKGRPQRARDLAEQILQLAGSPGVRQRRAWAAFADIYHRSRSSIDALIGLSCALELNNQVTGQEFWWETYTLFRIVRDGGLVELARQIFQTLQDLQVLLPEPERNQARMTSLELSVRLIEKNVNDLSFLNTLMLDSERHCRSMLNNDKEIMPAVALFAQSVGMLERAGGEVPPDLQDFLNIALRSLGESQANYLLAMSSSQPTIDDALHLFNRVDFARNADDIPGDLVAAELAARHFLRANENSISLKGASTAIEILSDHSLDPLGETRILDAEWPLSFLEKILPEDGAVIMSALDSEGLLTVLTVDDKKATILKRGSSDSSFRNAIINWSVKYPYQYGLIDRSEGNNEFFISMKDLDIPIPDAKRIIVVGEPTILQLPFNLLVKKNELAGNLHAIGYVPSLTWLDSVQKRSRTECKKRIAWISEPDESHNSSALAMVLSRTASTLDSCGFQIDKGGKIPADLAGSELVMIAAHGSITSNGNFFHRVSDEGGLAVTPLSLAASLAGVELVILFVCSGGRTDKHPFLNTAVGLPKNLLLSGCRAVIASPWPLSPSVTGPWLEPFMAEWNAGQTVLDATFIANKAVDKHFGLVPQYSLAMTAYGDVLLRKA